MKPRRCGCVWQKSRKPPISSRESEAQQLAERKQQISDLARALADLKSEAAGNLELLTESKDQFSSATHRLKSLEELAAHHAYSTEAVRLLLSASREATSEPFSNAWHSRRLGRSRRSV